MPLHHRQGFPIGNPCRATQRDDDARARSPELLTPPDLEPRNNGRSSSPSAGTKNLPNPGQRPIADQYPLPKAFILSEADLRPDKYELTPSLRLLV